MRFKGDIIITDPCYICKEKEEVGKFPRAKIIFLIVWEKYYPDTEKWMKTKLKR